MTHDPVCGMPAAPEVAPVEHGGIRHGFCSAECAEEFRRSPDRYLTETPIIAADDVTKEYRLGGGSVRALEDVHLRIFRGDFAAIVGRSGSGKSTLMHLLGLLDRPTAGRVLVAGADASALGERELSRLRGERIGFVFQKFHLIPSLSALQNVLLPTLFRPSPGAAARAKELLAEVGLAGRIHHRPNQLSGGEQQRVAIARALVNDPDIILADEPTGNLDSKTGKEILSLLVGLWRRGKTLIVVTHDLFIAEQAARSFTMQDGRIARGHAAMHAFIGLNGEDGGAHRPRVAHASAL
jgi:putative ABC transport system ATP-binding protein